MASAFILVAFGLIFASNFVWLHPLNSIAAVPAMYAAFSILMILPGIQKKGWHVLPRFCLVLYFLPMAPLIESMAGKHPDYADRYPIVDAALGNPFITTIISNIALVGLLGMGAGMLLGEAGVRLRGNILRERPRMLSLAMCIAWLLPLMILMYLTIPRNTILTMSYGEVLYESTSMISARGLDGLGYAIYIMLVCIYLDIETGELQGVPQRAKRRLFWASVAVVVIVFNLLRGGRSSAGMLAALAALYLTKVRRNQISNAPIKKRNLMKFLALALPVVLVFFSWDTIRNSADMSAKTLRENLVARVTSFYRSGTWMGGMFASVGMADDYASGNIEYLHGRTYLDYALSLPPSIVARALDYTRPLESTQGPAWWYMGYTVGGMHPIVVPFKNFGIFGVLVHMFLVGTLIGCAEGIAVSGMFAGRFIYGTIFVGSLHWFWYGDMYIIRALMGAAIVYSLYLLCSRPIMRLGVRPIERDLGLPVRKFELSKRVKSELF